MKSLHAHIGALHAPGPMHKQPPLPLIILLMLKAYAGHGKMVACALHLMTAHLVSGTMPAIFTLHCTERLSST